MCEFLLAWFSHFNTVAYSEFGELNDLLEAHGIQRVSDGVHVGTENSLTRTRTWKVEFCPWSMIRASVAAGAVHPRDAQVGIDNSLKKVVETPIRVVREERDLIRPLHIVSHHVKVEHALDGDSLVVVGFRNVTWPPKPNLLRRVPLELNGPLWNETALDEGSEGLQEGSTPARVVVGA